MTSKRYLVVLELELGLRGGEARDRHAIRRAGDVVEIAGAEKPDRIGIAAVLPADADLQFLVGAAAALGAGANSWPPTPS
jgi:hypothetical protein